MATKEMEDTLCDKFVEGLDTIFELIDFVFLVMFYIEMNSSEITRRLFGMKGFLIGILISAVFILINWILIVAKHRKFGDLSWIKVLQFIQADAVTLYVLDFFVPIAFLSVGSNCWIDYQLSDVSDPYWKQTVSMLSGVFGAISAIIKAFRIIKALATSKTFLKLLNIHWIVSLVIVLFIFTFYAAPIGLKFSTASQAYKTFKGRSQPTTTIQGFISFDLL